MGINAIKLNVN